MSKIYTFCGFIIILHTHTHTHTRTPYIYKDKNILLKISKKIL